MKSTTLIVLSLLLMGRALAAAEADRTHVNDTVSMQEAATEGLYARLGATQFLSLDDFDDEQSFGLALGFGFADKHRVEFEYQVNGFDSQIRGFEADADLFTYLLNYKYSFYRGTSWNFTAGVGLGFSQPEFGTSADGRGDDSILVWQAKIGAEYAINSNCYAEASAGLQHFGEMEDNGVSYDVGTPVALGLALGYRF